MADKKAEKTEKSEKDSSDSKKSGKRTKGGGMNKLLLVAVLLLGAAAGYVLKGGGGGSAGAAAETTLPPPPEPGMMVSIAPLSVNLADNHYLKIGLAVQLVDGAETTEGGGHGGSAATPEDAWLAEHGPVIRDLLISELGGAHVSEFANAAGRENLRNHLLEKANEHLEGSVYALYFTEFVMQ